MIIVLMGVSGCGKTTVGTKLASHLGWEYQEGDALHPQENILKMSDRVISLSRMTLTHSFAAIILLEQIYRSVTIEVNHPYHRN